MFLSLKMFVVLHGSQIFQNIFSIFKLECQIHKKKKKEDKILLLLLYTAYTHIK